MNFSNKYITLKPHKTQIISQITHQFLPILTQMMYSHKLGHQPRFQSGVLYFLFGSLSNLTMCCFLLMVHLHLKNENDSSINFGLIIT